jgi:hypothetical protein
MPLRALARFDREQIRGVGESRLRQSGACRLGPLKGGGPLAVSGAEFGIVGERSVYELGSSQAFGQLFGTLCDHIAG